MPLEDVIRHHTLAPLSAGIQFKRASPSAHSFFGAGSLRVQSKKLRICQACLAEDRTWHGFSFYRRHHQILGVNSCHKHGRPLTEVKPEARYHLPSDPGFEDLFLSPCVEYDLSPLAYRYGEVVVGLLDRKDSVSARTLSATIRTFLTESGPSTLATLVSRRAAPDQVFVDQVLRSAAAHSGADLRHYLSLTLYAAEISPLLYVLAALLVTPNEQIALNILTGTEVRGSPGSRKQRIPDEMVRKAYLESRGCYRDVERALGLNRSTVEDRLKKLNLPCNSSKNGRLFRSIDALSKGATFDQAVASGQSSADEVQKMLIALCGDRIQEIASKT